MYKVKTPKVCQVLGTYTALDLEWITDTHVLIAASFVNNLGYKKVYLNTHSEIALLQHINAELLEYDLSMGWNSSTSIENNNNGEGSDIQYEESKNFNDDVKCDLGILYERCEANGIDNIVSKSRKGSKTYYSIPGLRHIDLYQVYNKVMVQDTRHIA